MDTQADDVVAGDPASAANPPPVEEQEPAKATSPRPKSPPPMPRPDDPEVEYLGTQKGSAAPKITTTRYEAGEAKAAAGPGDPNASSSRPTFGDQKLKNLLGEYRSLKVTEGEIVESLAAEHQVI